MELEFFGANCFKVKTKEATVIVDDNLTAIGSKSVQSDKTVAFYTDPRLAKGTKSKSRLVIDSPGEFEVGDVTVTGVQARAHTDSEDENSTTVFQFMADSQTVTVLGHIHPDASAEVMELIGGTDVLVVPIGGNGFTLDPVGAAAIVKEVEPGYVIPSQYETKGLDYEVPAVPLGEFTRLFPAAGDDSEEGSRSSFKLPKNVEDANGQAKVIILKPNIK